MSTAGLTWTAASSSGRLVRLLDRVFVLGSIVLIPYDLPLIHQACLPLAALGGLLMTVRGDASAFLAFMRRIPLVSVLSVLVCGIALLSVLCNIPAVMESAFQGEAGWRRALLQGALLLVTVVYPPYLAFCLSRHGEWKELVIEACWWSLPIPFLVGFVQIANLLHVPGLAHLPYVGGAYDGGFWRLTSVARESSWFGSFACVILPFLVMTMPRLPGWRQLGGFAAICVVLLFVVLGTSKSAYAALAVEACVAGIIYLALRRPWRWLGKALFALAMLTMTGLLLMVFAPTLFEMIIAPFAQKAVVLYDIFAPLLLGNTRALSVGTRFGMSAAGIAMGMDHPLTGVGLGQFGFHVYNYTPLWGVNRETIDWLANDSKSWPSTSNLYTRLMAEAGLLAPFLYAALRLLLLAVMGIRLFGRGNSNWTRDLCIFSIMVALVVFDFHRDSFINLDIWVSMAMAMACWQERLPAKAEAGISILVRPKRMFFAVTAACFCLCMAIILAQPASYLASATVTGNSSHIVISQIDDALAPEVAAAPAQGGSFNLLRIYWGSANVAAHVTSVRPDLARAVMKGQPVTPSGLSRYIQDEITVLMADKSTTLTFQYRNTDPTLAKDFLATVIAQTDRAIAEGTAAKGAQAQRLLQLTLERVPDVRARQGLLARATAQDLQSDFDTAGDHPSFTFVEHPGIVPEFQSPRAAVAIPFALGLSLLTGAIAVMAILLVPAGSRYAG